MFKKQNLRTMQQNTLLLDRNTRNVIINIKKELYSNKELLDPVVFEIYDSSVEDEYEVLKRVIL